MTTWMLIGGALVLGVFVTGVLLAVLTFRHSDDD